MRTNSPDQYDQSSARLTHSQAVPRMMVAAMRIHHR